VQRWNRVRKYLKGDQGIAIIHPSNFMIKQRFFFVTLYIRLHIYQFEKIKQIGSMKWICTPVLLITIVANGQDGLDFNSIAEESSESLEIFGYAKPDFKWDMEGHVQAALNDGINYLDEGSPNLALPQLQDAVNRAPNLWVAHYFKGICLKQLKRPFEAEKEFLRVNELNDKNILNYIELGKTTGLVEYGKAEEWFKKAMKIDPADARPVYMLANHYMRVQYFDQAKKLYKQCLEMDPLMLDAEVKLAMIDVQVSKSFNSKNAIKYLEDVLAKDSLHKQALIFHGLLKIRDLRVSLEDFDRLVRTNPGNMSFRFVRGLLRAQNTQYELAFSDLRKVVDAAQINSNKFVGQQSKLDKRIDIEYAGFYVVSNVYGFPDYDALRLKKAYCLLFLGRYDEALWSIEGVKGSGKSALCLFLKGVANEHKGAHELAYYAYDNALSLDNDIIDAHKKRGIYRMEMKKWVLAEADFSQMLKINSEAYVAYRLRGLSRLNNDKFQGAIEDYSAYLDQDSTNNEVRGERAMAFKKFNQHLPSTLDLLKTKNFHALEPFSTMEVELNALLEKNDTTKALWWLHQFNKYGPGYIPARKMTLKLLAAQKKWADTEKCADEALTQVSSKSGQEAYTSSDQSYLLMMKAISLTQRDKAAEAIPILDKAINVDKDNAAAYLARADANLRLRNKNRAKTDLERAEKLGNKTASERLKGLR
jgi:tetratricopeptide (TPR) repeat protein